MSSNFETKEDTRRKILRPSLGVESALKQSVKSHSSQKPDMVILEENHKDVDNLREKINRIKLINASVSRRTPLVKSKDRNESSNIHSIFDHFSQNSPRYSHQIKFGKRTNTALGKVQES